MSARHTTSPNIVVTRIKTTSSENLMEENLEEEDKNQTKAMEYKNIRIA